MASRPIHPIEEAFKAARALPEPAQEALAAEIMARVAELGSSALTDAQRAEIKARLSASAIYADSAAVAKLFERQGLRE